MIKKLKLNYYRCFKEYEIDFQTQNILIGANNTGKSTIIEALRLIALAIKKYRNLTYRRLPEWIYDVPIKYRGFHLKIDGLNFKRENIIYKYNSDINASIEAEFYDSSKVLIYLNSQCELFTILFDSNGNNIKNRTIAKNYNFWNLKILPQIGPIREEEKRLSSEYVQRQSDFSNTSLHFRNKISLLSKEQFNMFKQLSEETWKGISISDFTDAKYNELLGLFIREKDFTVEVGWLGNGLQMWLQTLLFLSQCEENSSVILDEPDVYLHSDVQIRLINLLNNRFKQIILSTHSIDIINEIEKEEIIVIDKKSKKSKNVKKISDIQNLLENLGSNFNYELSKIFNTNLIIFVEGDDFQVLKKIVVKFFPKCIDLINKIPVFEIGGWGGWKKAINIIDFLKTQVSNSITPLAIFDRDFHVESELEERKKLAQEKDIILHIHQRKELENYFINNELIYRIINEENPEIEYDEIFKIIDKIINDTKEELIDKFAQEKFKEFKDYMKTKRYCEKKINSYWKNGDKIQIISGKTVLKKIFTTIKNNYNISLSKNRLIKEIKYSDFPEDFKDLLSIINKNL